jgi:CHAD domain-containing protein
MAEHLRAELVALPADLVVAEVAERIIDRLGADLVSSRARTLAALRAESYLRLVTDLRVLVTAPYEGDARRPARDVLPPLARRAGRRLAREVTALEAAEAGPERDRRYHEARKQAKRVRYAAEALIPLLGDDAVALVAFAEQAQNLLGEHQDAIVVSGLLRRWASEVAAEPDGDPLTYGVLLGVQLGRLRVAERDFAALWTRMCQSPQRRWLR